MQLPVYATGLFLVANQSGERLRLVLAGSALPRACWWPCVGGQLGLGAGVVKKGVGEDRTSLLGFKHLMEALLMATQPVAA